MNGIKTSIAETRSATIAADAEAAFPTDFQHKLLLLLLCLIVLISSHANAQSDRIKEKIQQLFPSATRIEDKQGATPVWPVYQLNEPLGYAFESNDLVDLTGFSGERINILIGIDTTGHFQGLQVLHHHEPIFLHGLGPQPLEEFIEQYPGHRVSDRIIVGANDRSAKSAADDTTAYFDGVTRATVSVIVINDTILSSALQVARAKLEAFAQSPPAVVRNGIFEPLGRTQLLQRGLLRRWHLSAEEVESRLGSKLQDYPQHLFTGAPFEDGITLYYGYLNAPVIGRNLLGDSEYRRLIETLKEGQHALAIFSEGFYALLEDSFRPGTVPERIGLSQAGLPISLRDLNFFNYSSPDLADDYANAEDLHVFVVNRQSGFNPSGAMELNLNMSLRKNHLVQDNKRFTDNYQLPMQLFEQLPQPEVEASSPLWLRIWQNRTIDIVVLLVGLAVLSTAFSLQRHFTHYAVWFTRFRWSFLFFTLIFIGFYAQGQLSVVNIYTLLLELINGFSLDVFLLDPVIFILWIYTAISLVLWGRGLYCGWLCPFGALQEMVSWAANRLRIRQIQPRSRVHQYLLRLKYLILIGLVGTSLLSLRLAEQLAEVEPFKTSITLMFVRNWPFVLYAVLLLAAAIFVPKFYCRYLCPLGAGLALAGKFRLFEWLRRRDECGKPCQMCRHRCGIDAINRDGSVDYNECIQCLECVVILRDTSQCAPARLAVKREHALIHCKNLN